MTLRGSDPVLLLLACRLSSVSEYIREEAYRRGRAE
jgi:hypothetical protein